MDLTRVVKCLLERDDSDTPYWMSAEIEVDDLFGMIAQSNPQDVAEFICRYGTSDDAFILEYILDHVQLNVLSLLENEYLNMMDRKLWTGVLFACLH